jgi:hypothetical protein
MLQGAALPASRAVEPFAPAAPPRIAQRPAATPAPTFASEIYATADHAEPVAEVKEKPSPKKARETKHEAVAVPEPVAVQPPPPPTPPPAPAPVARAEEPLRITPPREEPLRITPKAEEPLRITPKEEPLRITPKNEPLRITPRDEPEPVHGAYVPAATVEPKPELVPVPASVFDDDFFRKSNDELRPAPELRSWETLRETPREPVREPVRETPRETREPELTHELETVTAQTQKKTETHWPEARIPSFAGYAGGSSSSSEEDELDIPAFLRRSR